MANGGFKSSLETAYRRTYEADEAWLTGKQDVIEKRRILLVERGKIIARLDEIEKELLELNND